MENDDYYKNMDEDAFDVAAHYTNATELIEAKNYHIGKEGKINMCTAIKEMIEEERELINKLISTLLAQNRIDDLRRAAEDSEYQEQLIKELGLSE